MPRTRQRSNELIQRALRVIPGGVNSPVRAFNAVDADPVLIARGAGAQIWDVDHNLYLDYVCSWGPLILGHAHPVVVDAIEAAAKLGTSFGATTEREVEFAELLCQLVPSLQKVRLVSSGTEATMSAIRLARGFTGRDRLVKAVGGYHGHADPLLVRAGSGASTLGVPDSSGVPAGAAADTLLVPYNDLAAVSALFAECGETIAALIVEPVAGNMGVVPPADGYLAGLRQLTRAHGVLLVFDEVISGFRLGLGGAQQYFSVEPDLTCLGKIIGGGLPVGAYGGRADIMERVSPLGPVYQAGTLSGNPLAVAAGMATVRWLQRENPYPVLAARTAELVAQTRAAADKHGVQISINHIASMFTVFFAAAPVTNYACAAGADTGRYARFHRQMLDRGIYFAPSQFEAAFVSVAHSEADLDRTTSAVAEAFAAQS